MYILFSTVQALQNRRCKSNLVGLQVLGLKFPLQPRLILYEEDVKHFEIAVHTLYHLNYIDGLYRKPNTMRNVFSLCRVIRLSCILLFLQRDQALSFRSSVCTTSLLIYLEFLFHTLFHPATHEGVKISQNPF